MVMNFHFCSVAALNVQKTKKRNNTPCADPNIFVSHGSPNKCFRGTAINTRTNKEIPSRNPTILSRPVFVLRKGTIDDINGVLLKRFEFTKIGTKPQFTALYQSSAHPYLQYTPSAPRCRGHSLLSSLKFAST
jgi:hypothetical protein